MNETLTGILTMLMFFIALGVGITVGGIVLNVLFIAIVAIIAGIITYKRITYPIFASGLAYWISGSLSSAIVIGILSFLLLEYRHKQQKTKGTYEK